MNETQPALVSLNEACAMTTLSRTQINNLSREGRFPARVNLGIKRIAFVRSEVQQWIDDRIADRGT